MVKFRIFASVNEFILHKAIVVSANRQHITVDLLSGENDCHGCGIASLCNIKSGNRLTLPLEEASEMFRAGEKVILRTSGKSALKSALILFILPTLLVMTVAIALSFSGASEETTALAGLGAGVLYFIILYMIRKLTASAVRWIVEPAEN